MKISDAWFVSHQLSAACADSNLIERLRYPLPRGVNSKPTLTGAEMKSVLDCGKPEKSGNISADGWAIVLSGVMVHLSVGGR